MRISSRLVCASCLVAALVLSPTTVFAQWYEQDEAPPDEGQIVAPFTFKGCLMDSGVQLTTSIAAGDLYATGSESSSDLQITALSFVLRGGYAFESLPLLINLELPMAMANYEGTTTVLGATGDSSDSEFALGSVGLGIQTRLDPKLKSMNIFTSWSLDLYIPSFMNNEMMAHTSGLYNTLLPGRHLPQESLNVVGTFDLVMPGHLFFFQFELSVGGFFPVKNTDTRDVEGGLLWGAALGIHIIEELTGMIELKGYTQMGKDENDAYSSESIFALSAGLRGNFGVFKPGLFISLPLDQDYRDIWPDIITGIDLAAWF
jgi:hypothetical protein